MGEDPRADHDANLDREGSSTLCTTQRRTNTNANLLRSSRLPQTNTNANLSQLPDLPGCNLPQGEAVTWENTPDFEPIHARGQDHDQACITQIVGGLSIGLYGRCNCLKSTPSGAGRTGHLCVPLAFTHLPSPQFYSTSPLRPEPCSAQVFPTSTHCRA